MLVAAGAAWAGLGWLIVNVPPTRPFAQLGGYVFGFTAIAASAAFLAWLVLRPRLEQGRLRSPAGYLAHSMLLAVIALFALWLQSLRVLTPTVAILLIGLYAFLELAVLFGTRGSVELPLRR
jgi:drug/metabolite transporter (DMT)-like permease